MQSPTEDGLSSNAELFLAVPEPVPVEKVLTDAMMVQGKIDLRLEATNKWRHSRRKSGRRYVDSGRERSGYPAFRSLVYIRWLNMNIARPREIPFPCDSLGLSSFDAPYR